MYIVSGRLGFPSGRRLWQGHGAWVLQTSTASTAESNFCASMKLGASDKKTAVVVGIRGMEGWLVAYQVLAAMLIAGAVSEGEELEDVGHHLPLSSCRVYSLEEPKNKPLSNFF